MNYQKHYTSIDGKQASYHLLNETGINAHFYPANGFPVGAYNSFLKPLSAKYKLHSLALRACWDDLGAPQKQTKFDIYAQDLVAFLKQKFNKPLVGIGHSQGATCTLMAAAKDPDLFSELILIEPASLSKNFARAMAWTPYFVKKTQEPYKSTLQKPAVWSSKEDYLAYLQNSKAYKRVKEDILKEIVEHSLTEENDSFRLIFPPNWEVSNYTLPPHITHLFAKIKIPVRIIAGKPNIFFNAKLRAQWQKSYPHIRMDILDDYGHLLPFESPEMCGKTLLST